jgi:hypothetical protein
LSGASDAHAVQTASQRIAWQIPVLLRFLACDG